MIYDPYSVVVVPFPFADSRKSKPRPALVLSNRIFQKETGHITLAMITTASSTQWVADCPIKDLSEAGLGVSSVVRQKIFTLDRRLLKKKIGTLSGKDKVNVKKHVKKVFQDL